jgi:hypothetical protein
MNSETRDALVQFEIDREQQRIEERKQGVEDYLFEVHLRERLGLPPLPPQNAPA